jgi:hypothetical protein
MSGTALRKMAGVQRECYQVAVIPAKKLKMGQRKKSWPEEFVAEFWPNFSRIFAEFFKKGTEEIL